MKKSMKKQVVKQKQEPVVTEEPEEIESAFISGDDAEEITRLLNQEGSSSFKVFVQRYDEIERKWKNIPSVNITEYDPDLLSIQYNGGKFRRMIRDTSKQNSVVIDWHEFEYAEPVQPGIKRTPDGTIQNTPRAESDTPHILSFMKDQLSTNQSLFMGLFTSMIQVFSKVGQQNTNGAQTLGVKELLELNKYLINTQRTPTEDLSSAIKLQSELKKLAEVANGEKEESGSDDILTMFLKKLMPIIESRTPLQQPAHSPADTGLKVLGAVSGSQASIGQVQEKTEEKPVMDFLNKNEEQIYQLLKSYLPTLLNMAQLKCDTEPIVELIFEKLNDDGIKVLAGYLKTYGVIRLKKYIPEIEQHDAWFNNLSLDLIRCADEDLRTIDTQESVDGQIIEPSKIEGLID